MTSLKLFYRRGAPAALLLGLIVGSPDIAQAFTPLTGTGVGLESAPTYIPPSAPYIPPPSSSGTPATQVPNLAPRTQVPPGLALGTPLPHIVAQPPAKPQVKPNPGDPCGGVGPATGGVGDGGAGGIDLTHAGDGGDATGDAY
jgi:hypothetical protein